MADAVAGVSDVFQVKRQARETGTRDSYEM
jgi:hypothetical protein